MGRVSQTSPVATVGNTGYVQSEQVVVRVDDPRRAELEGEDWVVVAQSWAGRLVSSNVDVTALSTLVQRGRRHGEVREVIEPGLSTVLALDAATVADYPGGIATQHFPLTASTVRVTPRRRGFGVFDDAGRALAVTFVDIDGHCADTDFTAVAAECRGLGIGSAVKAASVLALLRDGVEVFRTGGAAENTAILAANQRLGYVIDEEWITLEPPGSHRPRSEPT